MASATGAISAEGRVRRLEGKLDLSSVNEKLMTELKKISKQKTNADRIRAMSDEELAKENIYFVSALNAREGLHYTGFDGHYYRTAEEVVEANMKWLQLEVEE